MIKVGNKKVGRFFIGASAHKAKSIGSLYKGSVTDSAIKIWEAISSCFGSGWWCGDKPWKGTDSWKN